MLHKFNILLLLDANMLLDIIQSRDTGGIHGVLSKWIGDILNNAEYKPRGKTIRLLVSTDIFKDYRSALGRRQYHINASLWTKFKKQIHLRRLVGDNTYFSTYKITGHETTPNSSWGGDKYDLAYFEALQGAFSTEKFGDHHVVFASNDVPTCARVEGNFLGKWAERLHVVSGKESLESLIME